MCEWSFGRVTVCPEVGKELRKDIKHKGAEAVKDTKEFCLDTQKKAKSVFDDTVDVISDACTKTKGFSSGVKYKRARRISGLSCGIFLEKVMVRVSEQMISITHNVLTRDRPKGLPFL